MEDHQFERLLEALQGITDAVEGLTDAIDGQNGVLPHSPPSEDPQTSDLEQVYAPTPTYRKPYPHLEIEAKDGGDVLLIFERGVPEELQEMVQKELLRHFSNKKMYPGTIDHMNATATAMLEAMHAAGLVLLDPRFPGRVWDFDECNANSWMHKWRNRPSLSMNELETLMRQPVMKPRRE